MTRSQDEITRALPARPNLEHLKNEAKSRLEQLRLRQPDAQLSDAQFRLAREYGFSSWRDLKAKVDAAPGTIDPTGDWIGQIPKYRIGLSLRGDAEGGYRAEIDLPDNGLYGLPVDDVQVENGRLTFTDLDSGSLYEGAWDSDTQTWVGNWTSNGVEQPLTLARGTFPPNPTVKGLDGLWDGILRNDEGEFRFTFRIRTDGHGTNGMFHSPDTNIRKAPLRGIRRDGQVVALEMRTFAVHGPLSKDGEVIDGVFRKGDWSAPLVLRRRRPGGPRPQRTLPSDIELPVETLQRYVGVYQFSQGRVLTVRMQHGRLFSEYDGRPPMALTPIRETEFRYPVGESGLDFFADEEGEGVRFKLENFVDWGRKRP